LKINPKVHLMMDYYVGAIFMFLKIDNNTHNTISQINII
jgi:hypothetical protein